jgi:hypothetical protein
MAGFATWLTRDYPKPDWESNQILSLDLCLHITMTQINENFIYLCIFIVAYSYIKIKFLSLLHKTNMVRFCYRAIWTLRAFVTRTVGEYSRIFVCLFSII